MHGLLSPRWAATVLSLVCVLIGMPVYGWVLLKSGVIRIRDLQQVPRLRRWIPHFVRWGWLKEDEGEAMKGVRGWRNTR